MPSPAGRRALAGRGGSESRPGGVPASPCCGRAADLPAQGGVAAGETRIGQGRDRNRRYDYFIRRLRLNFSFWTRQAIALLATGDTDQLPQAMAQVTSGSRQQAFQSSSHRSDSSLW